MSKVIVVTGSTRGIGHGLASAFTARGCSVVVGGRSQESTDRAVVDLIERHDVPEKVLGRPCDVRELGQVQALWHAACQRFGHVDIWINNAGLGTEQQDLWTHSAEELDAVVRTNIQGTLYGCQVAIAAMFEQGFGAVYNMEGLGSDGRRVPGLTLYGATKRAVRYLTDGLVEETKGTPVLVGALSPGMVTTDFLLERYDHNSEDWERAKRVFNILADRVETVTPWLADKVLSNTRHGARITWLTFPKIVWRFLTAPFTDRDVVSV
jgi:NAD(P)-dependent dehydrogenase (short-subunit alcohol dehydrogenase family)